MPFVIPQWVYYLLVVFCFSSKILVDSAIQTKAKREGYEPIKSEKNISIQELIIKYFPHLIVSSIPVVHFFVGCRNLLDFPDDYYETVYYKHKNGKVTYNPDPEIVKSNVSSSILDMSLGEQVAELRKLLEIYGSTEYKPAHEIGHQLVLSKKAKENKTSNDKTSDN